LEELSIGGDFRPTHGVFCIFIILL
jgi:hypothetical protein